MNKYWNLSHGKQATRATAWGRKAPGKPRNNLWLNV